MARESASKPILLVSELAGYPVNSRVFGLLLERTGRPGVVAAGRLDVLEVHRQSGWETPPGEVRHLPSRPGIGRLVWLTRLLREVQPVAIWIQQEPLYRTVLETLAAARITRTRSTIVCGVCQNIFPTVQGTKRLAARWAWSRLDALAAVASASIDGIRAAGIPASILAEPLVAGVLTPPAKLDPLPAAPETAFRIGFAGRLIAAKGVDVLLHALASLPQDATLLVAGAGPEESALRKLAAELEIAERVRFLGLLARNDMWRFLASIDCLVLPSRTTPTWKEQFGMVAVEAMACGVPVVGSDSGAIPEVLGDAGIVFPEGDKSTLVRQLRSLRDSPGLRAQLRHAGRSRYEREFSLSAYSGKLARLLRLEP